MVSEWYVNQLGFKEKECTDATCTLSKEGFEITLFEHSEAILLNSVDLPNEDSFIAGIYKYGFVVEDLDALFTSFQSKELDLFGGIITDDELNARSFILLDPEGNFIQFFESRGKLERLRADAQWQPSFIMLISQDLLQSKSWYEDQGFEEIANHDNVERNILQRVLFNGEMIIEMSQVGTQIAPKDKYPDINEQVTGITSLGVKSTKNTTVFDPDKNKLVLLK